MLLTTQYRSKIKLHDYQTPDLNNKYCYDLYHLLLYDLIKNT